MNLFDDNLLPFALPPKNGYSAQWINAIHGFELHIPNGELIYIPDFFNAKICARTVEYFLENEAELPPLETDWRQFEKDKLSQIKFKNIQWQHDQIQIFGRKIFLPRYSAWYGDNDKPYTYSGLTLQPKTWNKGLLYIKDAIEKVAQVSFNSVLINWYRDGDDHIGWHTDAEPELGKNPIIASINFGESRRFQVRRTDNHKEKIDIPLHNGTLLIMRGELQHFWQHAVPKESKVHKSRFNLTFRQINHK